MVLVIGGGSSISNIILPVHCVITLTNTGTNLWPFLDLFWLSKIRFSGSYNYLKMDSEHGNMVVADFSLKHPSFSPLTQFTKADLVGLAVHSGWLVA